MSRRKKKHEEEEKLERWLVSYADFITLLFAFFTVLYALSQTDKTKYKSAAESIQRAFMSAGGIFALKGMPFTPFDKPPDKGSQVPPSPESEGKMNTAENESMDKMKQQIRALFETSTGLSIKHGDIEVWKTEEGFKIRLSEKMLYRPGSDLLKKEDVPFLYVLGKKLGRLGLNIQVEGHTDSRHNGSENNWQLSLNRSYNVVRFMIDGAGFPRNQISVAGFADTKPISDNDTPEGRARNRRVEISVFTGNRDISSLSL
jgi:chemotaxis protein MotB